MYGTPRAVKAHLANTHHISQECSFAAQESRYKGIICCELLLSRSSHPAAAAVAIIFQEEPEPQPLSEPFPTGTAEK